MRKAKVLLQQSYFMEDTALSPFPACEVDLKSWLSPFHLRLGQTNLPPGEAGEVGRCNLIGRSLGTGTEDPLGTLSDVPAIGDPPPHYERGKIN